MDHPGLLQQVVVDVATDWSTLREEERRRGGGEEGGEEGRRREGGEEGRGGGEGWQGGGRVDDRSGVVRGTWRRE